MQLFIRRGQWVDLHTQYFPDSWADSEARAINDLGWIVGVAADDHGSEIAWMLVPEPATLSLLALGGLAVLGRRRLTSA